MAKKKVAKVAGKPLKKTVVAKKKTVVKKVVKREAGAPVKKAAGKRAAPAVKSLVKAAPSGKTVTPVSHDVSLGRPLVTQEEKLFMLFHSDYLARQVFEFLRVETVKELEQYSAQQIIHLMSRPVREAVDRIRKRLAEMKRSLRDDEQFAVDYREQTKGR